MNNKQRNGQKLVNYVCFKYKDRLPVILDALDLPHYYYAVEHIIWNVRDEEFNKIFRMTDEEVLRMYKGDKQ